MLYIIDSANNEEIKDALSLGACGVTANPAMYLKNHQNFYTFLREQAALKLPFLSGEVMGETLEEMREEVEKIHAIDQNIVIKLNFSPNTLRPSFSPFHRLLPLSMLVQTTFSRSLEEATNTVWTVWHSSPPFRISFGKRITLYLL